MLLSGRKAAIARALSLTFVASTASGKAHKDSDNTAVIAVDH